MVIETGLHLQRVWDQMSAKTVSAIGQAFQELQSACLSMQGLHCRACAEACQGGAIQLRSFAGGYARPEVDLACCDGCGACLAACPLRSTAEAAA